VLRDTARVARANRSDHAKCAAQEPFLHLLGRGLAGDTQNRRIVMDLRGGPSWTRIELFASREVLRFAKPFSSLGAGKRPALQ
jgi:hypothetical protein